MLGEKEFDAEDDGQLHSAETSVTVSRSICAASQQCQAYVRTEKLELNLYAEALTGFLQGVSKNAPLCLTAHRGYQKWTINKSRVSFEKFRKYPF